MSTAQQTTENGSAQYPFLARQGRTFTLEITVQTYQGRAYDLTGRTGSGHLRVNYSDVSPAASFTVTLTSATRGIAQAQIGADVMEALASGTYIADIEFELDATDIIGTDTFYVRVSREVTQ